MKKLTCAVLINYASKPKSNSFSFFRGDLIGQKRSNERLVVSWILVVSAQAYFLIGRDRLHCTLEEPKSSSDSFGNLNLFTMAQIKKDTVL